MSLNFWPPLLHWLLGAKTGLDIFTLGLATTTAYVLHSYVVLPTVTLPNHCFPFTWSEKFCNPQWFGLREFPLKPTSATSLHVDKNILCWALNWTETILHSPYSKPSWMSWKQWAANVIWGEAWLAIPLLGKESVCMQLQSLSKTMKLTCDRVVLWCD